MMSSLFSNSWNESDPSAGSDCESILENFLVIEDVKEKDEPSAQLLFDITSDNESFELNKSTLEGIFGHKDVKEKAVYVVSIAGTFRQGKSFLLNFLIRYLKLKYKCKKIHNDEKWLDPADGPLTGFSFQSGSVRHTIGILIWPEVFTAEVNGEEIGIILMDTQGSFDNESTFGDSATIFTLSTLISSLQIYNLKENIKGDDLSHLQFFTEYASLLPDDSSDTDSEKRMCPFQNLLFLVRDWQWPYEKQYGSEGGKKLLEKVLHMDSNKKQEILSIRQSIRDAFSNIDCYLLPHPGKTVATDPNFKGDIKDVDEDFLKYVEKLAPLILSPDNLIPKTIYGKKIKGQDFIKIIEDYWECLNNGNLPAVESVSLANARIQHSKILEDSVSIYLEKMSVLDKLNHAMEDKALSQLHEDSKSEALEYFRKKKKMCGNILSKEYETRLEDVLDKEYEKYLELIKKKQHSHRSWFKYVIPNKKVVASVVPVAVVGASGYAMLVTEVITEIGAVTSVAAVAGLPAVIVPLTFTGLAGGAWLFMRKRKEKTKLSVPNIQEELVENAQENV